ncbi:hypothetical protein AOLI_G00046080 [Acnodon oligacanthus]
MGSSKQLAESEVNQCLQNKERLNKHGLPLRNISQGELWKSKIELLICLLERKAKQNPHMLTKDRQNRLAGISVQRLGWCGIACTNMIKRGHHGRVIRSKTLSVTSSQKSTSGEFKTR